MDPLSRTERDWGMRLAAERGPLCLEADQLLALAEKGRRAPNAADLYAHIAACPGCRAALKELKQLEVLRTTVATAPAAQSRWFFPRRILWPVAAAAALLLAYFAFRALPGSSGSSHPESMAKKVRPAEPAPRATSEAPPPELAPPTPSPAPKLDSIPIPEASNLKVRRRRRPTSPTPAKEPEPAAIRAVETMDANIGWSRDELSGEVIGENMAVGEVVPPNEVQGEVKGGKRVPPEEPQHNG